MFQLLMNGKDNIWVVQFSAKQSIFGESRIKNLPFALSRLQQLKLTTWKKTKLFILHCHNLIKFLVNLYSEI